MAIEISLSSLLRCLGMETSVFPRERSFRAFLTPLIYLVLRELMIQAATSAIIRQMGRDITDP